MSEFLNPANQQRSTTEGLQAPVGSASTIVDPSASAQASSAIDTPLDGVNSTAYKTQNHNYRIRTVSPLDVRRHLVESTADQLAKERDVMSAPRDVGSSPLTSRAYLNTSAPRPPAITAGSGRFGVR